MSCMLSSPVFRPDSCNIMSEESRPTYNGKSIYPSCISILSSFCHSFQQLFSLIYHLIHGIDCFVLPCAVNDSTNTNLFGSDLLPFVDRPRPDLSRPRTVAGLYQKNSSACWKVMKTKSKFNKEVEHKHDRPWSTPHSQARKTLSKPVADEQGTMTLETFLKIKAQVIKQDASIGNTAKSM
jgi:hypothetical protein